MNNQESEEQSMNNQENHEQSMNNPENNTNIFPDDEVDKEQSLPKIIKGLLFCAKHSVAITKFLILIVIVIVISCNFPVGFPQDKISLLSEYVYQLLNDGIYGYHSNSTSNVSATTSDTVLNTSSGDIKQPISEYLKRNNISLEFEPYSDIGMLIYLKDADVTVCFTIYDGKIINVAQDISSRILLTAFIVLVYIALTVILCHCINSIIILDILKSYSKKHNNILDGIIPRDYDD